jgi:uncharacterized glyoxalase superfamily protein PhnB
MKFRVARHTKDLVPIIGFYQQVLGLENLGSFNGHNGYDGVFLGLPGLHWHLEFTQGGDDPSHKPDDDDLLVFYATDREHFEKLLNNIRQSGIEELPAKNSYWNHHGVTIADPDGFRIVVVKPSETS